MWTYHAYFRDMFNINPEVPLVMLFRTPLTPIFYGISFDLFGKEGIPVILALLYAGTAATIFYVMLNLGRFAAWMTVLLLAANMWYFRCFNSVGSETMQTVLVCVWFAMAFFAMKSRRVIPWVMLAVVVVLLVLNRPGNQTFALSFLLPFFVFSAGWRRRVVLAVVFLAVYLAGHLGYASLNAARYGYFAIAKLGNAHMPFYRLFVQERLIRPENGPASRRLADFVSEKILTIPVFQEHEITEETFFRYSSQRMFNALLAALQAEAREDGEFSLNQDYVILRKAAVEALLADPVGSIQRFTDHLLTVFRYSYDKPFKISNLNAISQEWRAEAKTRFARYTDLGLPLPDGQEFLPGTPMYLARDSPGEGTWFGWHVLARSWDVVDVGPPSPQAKTIFKISHHLIPNYYWFALAGLLWVGAWFMGQRDFRIPILATIALFSLCVSLFGSLQWDFRCPFDPVFTSFVVGGAAVFVAGLSSRLRWFQNHGNPLEPPV